IAVAGDGVGALAEHDGVSARRVVLAKIDTAEPAAEVERHPGNALADAFGDQRLHPGARAVFGAAHPDPAAVLDAAIGGIAGTDFDEHVLLQFGEPRIGTRLLATALIFDQATRGQDDRKLFRDPLFNRSLLNREADIGQAEL